MKELAEKIQLGTDQSPAHFAQPKSPKELFDSFPGHGVFYVCDGDMSGNRGAGMDLDGRHWTKCKVVSFDGEKLVGVYYDDHHHSCYLRTFRSEEYGIVHNLLIHKLTWAETLRQAGH